MSRTILTIERLGSPSAAVFEAAVNAALSSMLSDLIGVVDILVTDKLPQYARQFKAIIDTDTAGTLITNPYKLKVIEGDTDNTAKVLAEEFINGNPGYFFAPVDYLYSDQLPNVPQRSLLFLFYNESLADGLLNWQPGYAPGGGGGGGPPTGAAGGDLSGTYPNPIVGPTTSGSTLFSAMGVGSNVIGTAAIALVQDVEWEVVLFKGTTRYSCTIRANIGDGVSADYGEQDTVISPSTGGTFDVPLTVVISGANMTLVATPASVGWSARVRAHTFAA